MLTKGEITQNAALLFIERYQEQHGGISPSLEEIATGIGQKSKGYAHRIVERLVSTGRLRKIDNRWRAMEVTQKKQYFIFDDETKEVRQMFPLPKAQGCV